MRACGRSWKRSVSPRSSVVAIEPQGDAGTGLLPAERPAIAGQRLLALVLTCLLGIGAAGLFVMAPSLISDYRAEVRFFESPAFVPRVALLLVALYAVAHAIRVARGAILDAGEELDDAHANRHVVLLGVALFAGYVVLVPLIGYALATAVFTVAAATRAGLGWRKSLLLAIALAASAYVLFVLGLNVWFPAPGLL